MAIVNIREVNFIKLKSLKKEYLKEFCEKFSIAISSNIAGTIEKILEDFDSGRIKTSDINDFIKSKYQNLRSEEIIKTGATHKAILSELNKIDVRTWGMVQGAVDAHIQSNYVRKFFRFEDVISAIREGLYQTIESYTLSTWYNHWSTVFLEDLINENKNVVPIIKKVKGVDIIWNEQPLDIKVTNLPREWFKNGLTFEDALSDPKKVCKYMYQLQGAQRFGSENRLFIVIFDRNKPEESWKIKRDYNLIKSKINDFFDQAVQLDAINFSFGRNQYLAHSKVMFIVK